MTDDGPAVHGDERQRNRSVVAQRIDDSAFLVLPEGLSIHIASGGDVTGAADAMIFPDLLSANLTVKGIMYTANCRFGGVLRGTTQPVVFMSRADTVETRLNSLAYALHLLK